MERVVDEGLAFDDVLLLPGESSLIPSEVNLATQLTKSITLGIPMVSAAMDTVTEHPLAIALAKAGGLGFIHKNISIEDQVAEVKKVKKYEAGVVLDPHCVSPDTTIEELRKLSSKLGFSTYPVVDRNKILLGLITRTHLKFRDELTLTAAEIMTPASDVIKVTRHAGCTPKSYNAADHLSSTLPFTHKEIRNLMYRERVGKILVVDDAGRLTGLITHQDFTKSEDQPNACRDMDGSLRVGAAVGWQDVEIRTRQLVEAGVDVVVVDSSHGHSDGVLQCIRRLKTNYPSLQVVGGNVATADGALAVANAGADAVKVGIGPGSICTTRVVTGVGCPQFTAISRAAMALKDRNIPVIADGGIRFSGDIAKAIGAGASCVMVGSLLAGTEESPGIVELYAGRAVKSYRGMGSLAAMKAGSADRYFQGNINKLVPEGVEGWVPYKGPLADTIHQQMMGLRSSMSHTGLATIEALRTCAKFIRVSSATIKENHTYNVDIRSDPPNYTSRDCMRPSN